VNEYDIVARADKQYIRSLIELRKAARQSQSISNSGQDRLTINKAIEPTWLLPEPVCQHIGRIVVLKVSRPTSDMRNTCSSSSSSSSELVHSAWEITPNQLSQLVFCKLSVHGRAAYRDRIRQIEQGRFNGRQGWS